MSTAVGRPCPSMIQSSHIWSVALPLTVSRAVTWNDPGSRKVSGVTVQLLLVVDGLLCLGQRADARHVGLACIRADLDRVGSAAR